MMNILISRAQLQIITAGKTLHAVQYPCAYYMQNVPDSTKGTLHNAGWVTSKHQCRNHWPQQNIALTADMPDLAPIHQVETT